MSHTHGTRSAPTQIASIACPKLGESAQSKPGRVDSYEPASCDQDIAFTARTGPDGTKTSECGTKDVLQAWWNGVVWSKEENGHVPAQKRKYDRIKKILAKQHRS
ncbi:hypothetical protein Bbelb_151080 [Branchiostoma belcheri]|nr:hypothetical protein Bbelb_151080 [Branchiostoma belcheri]